MNGVVIFYFLSWSIRWNRQLRMDWAYDLDKSRLYLTKYLISLAASSLSLYWWLCSSWEIKETIRFLKYGNIYCGLCGASLPRILIVFILISLLESFMQLKSMSKFSYLEINGSKSSLRHMSIAFLMLISGSVVAVKKNLCSSLLTCISWCWYNFCLSWNFKLLNVCTASFLIYGLSLNR